MIGIIGKIGNIGSVGIIGKYVGKIGNIGISGILDMYDSPRQSSFCTNPATGISQIIVRYIGHLSEWYIFHHYQATKCLYLLQSQGALASLKPEMICGILRTQDGNKHHVYQCETHPTNWYFFWSTSLTPQNPGLPVPDDTTWRRSLPLWALSWIISISDGIHSEKSDRREKSIKCVLLAATQSWSRHIYCRVPEGQGLHQTARPPGRNKTRSVNPLVCNTHKALRTDRLF